MEKERVSASVLFLRDCLYIAVPSKTQLMSLYLDDYGTHVSSQLDCKLHKSKIYFDHHHKFRSLCKTCH